MFQYYYNAESKRKEELEEIISAGDCILTFAQKITEERAAMAPGRLPQGRIVEVVQQMHESMRCLGVAARPDKTTFKRYVKNPAQVYVARGRRTLLSVHQQLGFIQAIEQRAAL